eukprot:CAMPEP_0171306650 /NCGR_PEP_ID=MMETSP0816-20121228/16677_1 /TAXON_ID=420281 /ORGANISM="Proboscia inermis, Strain CCAP1064/1" /LENGTH=167 /DNA_ID=CAMNT_0011788371 /DNA_START=36 /DNA_END=539 /DNA_ORIENTATION=-
MSETQPGLDLDSLSLDQLSQVKQQEEQRLKALTDQYGQLRAGNARFHSAKDALENLKASDHSSSTKEIMVPLTESLYVPGKIKDSNKIMVDLGTGFYVEKSSKDACSFLDRKMKLVEANSSNVLQVIQGTKMNMQNIQISMQGKMMQIRARQEASVHQAKDASERDN